MTLSTSKGEDYENVKSSVVDGCHCAWNSGHNDGGASWMLRFR
jgi:hypothetical protein